MQSTQNSIGYKINLVKELVIAELKLRYGGTMLGYFWSLIRPLLMFGILYLVFTKFVRLDIKNYPHYLLLGIILWNYFAETTLAAMLALHNRMTLIRKAPIPISTIIVAASITTLLILIVNVGVYLLYFFGSGLRFEPIGLLFIPILLQLYILTLGISFGLAILSVFIRDLPHVWDVFLQLGFWATPIIYSFNQIPPSLNRIFLLNPMARIIFDSRNAVIFHMPPASLRYSFVSIFITLMLFVLGYGLFRWQRKKIPELI